MYGRKIWKLHFPLALISIEVISVKYVIYDEGADTKFSLIISS